LNRFTFSSSKIQLYFWRIENIRMEEDTKKISFSFKQTSSKPKVMPVASKTAVEKTVQFIECVEEKSIKVIGLVENKAQELVIPMQPSVKRRLPAGPAKSKQNSATDDTVQENGAPTLDDMAIQAILSDCHKTAEDKEGEDPTTIEVPMIVNPPEGKEMSTAEDYENVPVNKFGLAMLRGMGWEATKGVGKNSQVIKPSLPELRPKGMGLGADKLIKSVQKKINNSEEELKLQNGSYVQFVIGRLDGQYAQVNGFDEDTSRVVVKIARTGQMEKVSENTFRLVTKSDYDKNSKVINIKEYKNYHEAKTRQDDGSEDRIDLSSKKSRHEVSNDHRSRHHKTKKSKHSKSPHRKHKSDHNRHKKYKRRKSSS